MARKYIIVSQYHGKLYINCFTQPISFINSSFNNSQNIEYIKISINLLDTEISYRYPHERYINFKKIGKHAECIPSFFILHIITYYDAYFHIYETQEEAEKNKESKMLEAEEKNMSGVEFVEISSSQSFLSKLTK